MKRINCTGLGGGSPNMSEIHWTEGKWALQGERRTSERIGKRVAGSCLSRRGDCHSPKDPKLAEKPKEG